MRNEAPWEAYKSDVSALRENAERPTPRLLPDIMILELREERLINVKLNGAREGTVNQDYHPGRGHAKRSNLSGKSEPHHAQ